MSADNREKESYGGEVELASCVFARCARVPARELYIVGATRARASACVEIFIGFVRRVTDKSSERERRRNAIF